MRFKLLTNLLLLLLCISFLLLLESRAFNGSFKPFSYKKLLIKTLELLLPAWSNSSQQPLELSDLKFQILAFGFEFFNVFFDI
jgi:hypothetical protein